MLVCPVCKSEYQDGYKVCSDCKCDLIDVAEEKEEELNLKGVARFVTFIGGILLIFFAPIISYKLTSRYFFSNGYISEQFNWMLSAYHYSLLIIGVIICLPGLVYWLKNSKLEK